MEGGTIHGPSLLAMLLALFCCVECLMSLGIWRSGIRGERLRKRLRQLAANLQDPENDPAQASIVRERLGNGERQRALAWIEDHTPFRRLSLLLYRAGWTIGTWRLIALSVTGSLAAFAIGFQASGALFGSGIATLALLTPVACAAYRKRARTRLFERQLPEALDLICRALRAGHALSVGIQMVADELDDPIAHEFGQMADEIGLGMDSREALANLCTRVEVEDLGFFSTAVLIQRETGGNLADVMQRLSSVIRQRHLFEGKVKAMTAQNRGAALVLLFTPPSFVLLMYKVSPEFLEPLFQPGAGRVLATVAAALTVGGYLIARRLAVVHA